ncbi:MAG: helix-turn-helix domain-containing protein [Ruminococcus sp.]|jgi:transposase-like protein|nr:helix-turn-helix domain-containing protein [Ruminococcus sp.]
MRKKGSKNKVYSPEFKIAVVKALRERQLTYRFAAEEFEISANAHNGMTTVKNWERIYLEEGEAGLMEEKRGGKGAGGRPKKLKPEVEEDLIAEVQRLRAENEYLKKLDALVRERKLREKGLK